MIYRILTASDHRVVCKAYPYPVPDEDRLCYDPLRGAQNLFGDVMGEIGLPIPRREFRSPRSRFWFTDLGWKRYGIRLVAYAERWRGTIVHIISEKNPDRSRIVYQDEYQLALLPNRSKGGR